MKQIFQIHLLTILLISNLFSYENAFSHSSTGKINLQHSPEFTDVNGGYSRLVKIGQGHTTEAGMPELPQFTTYYQLNPEKTYAFELEILDSYTIENITILPHLSMDICQPSIVRTLELVPGKAIHNIEPHLSWLEPMKVGNHHK